MANRVGIISDTHLTGCSDTFKQLVDLAFRDCKIIIHAGDITDLGVLDAFSEKTLYAVHGNMCSQPVKKRFPESRSISIDGYTITICHGAGMRTTIEEGLYDRFFDADCIIYGHTHRPVRHRVGKILFINPGSFSTTGRFGNPGTYAILETTENGLTATLHSLPRLK